MIPRAFSSLAALALFAGPAVLAQSGPSGAPPQIFAPGVISGPANDGAPAFSPDGSSLYFTRSGANGVESIILESHHSSAGWSLPIVCSFSGEWYDSSPTIAKDGRVIVFQSSRPTWKHVPGAKPRPVPSHLWQVTRTASGWSDPEELPGTVNISALVYRPSLATDGSLYFISRESADAKFRLYFSKLRNGIYQKAQPLPFSDGSTFDVDPEISADGSFLVYGSMGHDPYKDAREHLFIVFRSKEGWGEPEPLHYEGEDWAGTTFDDDPRLGLDGRTLYFSSDRSPPVKRPTTHATAQADLERMALWDNGAANVWTLPLDPWIPPASR